MEKNCFKHIEKQSITVAVASSCPQFKALQMKLLCCLCALFRARMPVKQVTAVIMMSTKLIFGGIDAANDVP